MGVENLSKALFFRWSQAQFTQKLDHLKIETISEVTTQIENYYFDITECYK